ncbi:MAG: pectate lyase, partial [Planctomycetes bacterium]|nr:pectate lyase [Planctomycetota bacterium]
MVCATGALALAETFYVSPSGNDKAAGSEREPFATLGRAEEALKPGDTV